MKIQKTWPLVWFLLGLMTGLVPGIYKVKQLQGDVNVTIEQTSRELTELRQSIARKTDLADKETALRQDSEEQCRESLAGDGTQTILIDVNHPYGNYSSFAPAVTFLRAIPGPVWIIPRRVVPSTLDGTLNGAYAYRHQDGTMDGWFKTGGIR